MRGSALPSFEKQRLILVTGPSGAGRSTAINALEDIGYEAIDNLPLSLLPRLMQGPAHEKPLALGLDTRNREFSTGALMDAIEELSRRSAYDFDVLYVECSDDVLLRRFSETRRRHPLAGTDDPLRGIAREKQMLASIRDRASILINCTHFPTNAACHARQIWFLIAVFCAIPIGTQICAR